MRTIHILETGDKLVIKKVKEGGRWNDMGLMDKYLGATLTIEKAFYGNEKNYYFSTVEGFEDDFKWSFFGEMIDMEETIKINTARISVLKA